MKWPFDSIHWREDHDVDFVLCSVVGCMREPITATLHPYRWFWSCKRHLTPMELEFQPKEIQNEFYTRHPYLTMFEVKE